MANRVRELREARGLSAYRLALLVGFSNAWGIIRIERGEVNPLQRTRVALARIFGVNIDELGFDRPPYRCDPGQHKPHVRVSRRRTEDCPFCGDRCLPENKYIPPNGAGRYPWYHSRNCYEAEIATQEYA